MDLIIIDIDLYMLMHQILIVSFIILPFTFNDELIVVALFNIVSPDIFKVDINVEGLFIDIQTKNVGRFNIEL